jgi:hypothetical protein
MCLLCLRTPVYYVSGLYSDRSVAHGVSHGKARNRSEGAPEGRNIFIRHRCSAALRLIFNGRLLPTARAVGYRSSATPRLPIPNHRLKSGPRVYAHVFV